MEFPASRIAHILNRLGEDALVGMDRSVLRVQYHSPGALVELFGQMVVVDNVTAVCSEAVAAALEITGGVSGTASELTIRGNDYRVISAVPDGVGFSILTLEKLA